MSDSWICWKPRIEHQAVAEDLVIKGLRRHREMLHRPGQVAEPDVDELHRLRLDEPQDLIAAREHPPSLGAHLQAGARVWALLER
jgi:hypothetical protein